ncbi:MAG: tyrosine-type recombinase/integrase [Coriobacteriales bacterium]|nr:tyrosine-type recombinase/integrase [Coriobacteriales bacterium]
MARNYTNGFVNKDHGMWRAFIHWYGDDGKRHRISKSTGVRCSANSKDNRNKSYAEKFLREWRDELVREESAREEAEARTDNETPLADHCKAFIDLHHAKPSTISGYVTTYRKLLGTPMGTKPMGEVTADDVRQWEADLREDGLSDTTIAHYHAFLAQVMKGAAAEGKIERNPMLTLKAPRRRPKPVNSPTSETRAAILSKLDTMGDAPFAVAVRIAILTGMRRGEICALRWQDVDLQRRSIHVVHGLTKDHGFKLDTPKDPSGGDSKRIIPIGNVLTDHLRRHREWQREDLRNIDSEWSDTLYVVGNHVTGEFLNPEMLSREWRMLVRAEGWVGTQGEPLRLHDLRHGFATLCIKDHVMDVMALSRILGHRDASMTLNIYADALEESKRSGMDALDATL